MIAVKNRGVNEGAHERSRSAGRRLQLRLEQRRDEEGMARQLHHARVAAIVLADDVQSGVLDRVPELRIETVIAVIPLDDAPATVNRRRATGRIEKHGSRFTDERAAERRDDRCGRVGIRFGVIGVANAGDVARILEDRVLESAANTEKRKPGETRMTHSGERAIETRVRTAGRQPYRVGQRQSRLDTRRKRWGGYPAPLERVLAQLANMTECFIDREMGIHRRVMISDNGETCWDGHDVLRPPDSKNRPTQLRVTGFGFNLKTLITGRRQVAKRLRPKEPMCVSVGDAAQLLAMARGFGAVAARRHVAPAATAVLGAVVKHTCTACIGATTNPRQLAQYERVRG